MQTDKFATANLRRYIVMKKAKEFLKHPLFSGSFLMIGGSLANNGVNYIYHLLMGRILGPVSYGNLASLFSLIYLLNIIPTSTSFAIVKYISSAKDKKERSKIYRSSRKLIKYLSIAMAVIILFLSPWINNFLHLNDLYSVVIIAPIAVVSLITLVNKATLQGMLKFFGVVGSETVSSVGKLIIGLVLVTLGYSVGGAITGILISVIFAYFFTVKYIKNQVNLKTKLDYDIKPMIKYAIPVALQALAFTSLFTVDLVIVKHFLPDFDAGLYASLSTLGKIIFFATAPVSAVMFPIVSSRRSKGKAYRVIFFLSLLATFGMSFFVLTFYYLFPEIAIGVLYGKEYLRASADLVWMGIFMTFYTTSYLLVNFLLSLNRTKIVILPLVISGVQIVVLWIRHANVREVLYVNTSLAFTLFVGLFVYLGYNEITRRKRYAKTKTK